MIFKGNYEKISLIPKFSGGFDNAGLQAPKNLTDRSYKAFTIPVTLTA
jgi:hypothetical protein